MGSTQFGNFQVNITRANTYLDLTDKLSRTSVAIRRYLFAMSLFSSHCLLRAMLIDCRS